MLLDHGGARFGLRAGLDAVGGRMRPVDRIGARALRHLLQASACQPEPGTSSPSAAARLSIPDLFGSASLLMLQNVGWFPYQRYWTDFGPDR